MRSCRFVSSGLTFFVAGWLGFAAQAYAQTTVSGTTPGQFSVSESGAATYRIPIQVPPGIAGMEPRLELAYNSQGGNGLLGVGWNLGGLSAIGLCPRTMAQDGARGSINFDANDRFCMDGQRLILVAGTYGAAASEYRTEIESFSKITAYGAAGNGPAYFIVKTKAGQTIEYGNTADSRVEAQGKTTPRLWAVNKISDVKSNFLMVSYVEDNANGDHYPSRIDYSGNTALGVLNPPNSVRFVYEARPDLSRMYLGGSLVAPQKRLLKIQTFVGPNQLAEYRATYDTSTVSARSRLLALTQCTGDNTACLAAKNFTWQNGGQGLTQSPATTVQTVTGDWKTPYGIYPGDYNGDGIADLYRIGSTGSYFCAGPGISTTSNCVLTLPGDWKTSFAIYPGDYNGDGITDLYFVGTGASYFCAGPGISTTNNCVLTVTGDWKTPFAVYAGDYNGDGIMDLYLVGTGASYFCAGPGISTTNNCVLTVTGDWKTPFAVYPGDYNGDGIMDLYLVGTGASYFCAGPGISTTNNCVLTVTGDWKTPYGIYPGDYNGDGIVDLYLVGSTVSHFCPGPAVTQTNAGSACVATVSGDWKTPYGIYPGDYNGDGITDLYLVGSTVSHFCPGPAVTRTNAGSACIATGSGDWKTPYGIYPGDYNGDGTTDLYLVGTSSSSFAAGGIGRADLLASVSDGANLSVTIVNAPISAASVYSKGTGAVFPVQEVQAPIYVVSSVARPNGIGGTATTTYKFGGLRAEAGTGRGLLGFNWVESTEVATGLTSRSTYRQDFPFTGIPVLSETRLAGSGNSGVLKRTTVTPGCKIPQTAAACAVAVGNRYFPYATSNVEESWELNGTAYPSITTSYLYEQSPIYGDPTKITVTNNSDASSKTTENTYWPADTTNWILGRLKQTKVTSVGATGGSGTGGAGAQPLGLTVNPSAVSVSRNLAGNGVTSVTATVSGGYAPYTFSWARVAGTKTTITNSATATPTFTAPVSWAQNFNETMRVTLTDSIGGTITRDLPVNYWAPQALTLTMAHSPASFTPGCGVLGATHNYVTSTPTAAGGFPPYQFTWAVTPSGYWYYGWQSVVAGATTATLDVSLYGQPPYGSMWPRYDPYSQSYVYQVKVKDSQNNEVTVSPQVIASANCAPWEPPQIGFRHDDFPVAPVQFFSMTPVWRARS